jgi:hypothetical protein
LQHLVAFALCHVWTHFTRYVRRENLGPSLKNMEVIKHEEESILSEYNKRHQLFLKCSTVNQNNYRPVQQILVVPWLRWLVSRQPLTAENRDLARVSSCGVCGGQSATGTGFSPSSWVLPCLYHSTVALHTHISSRG